MSEWNIAELIWSSVVLGIGATFVMDCWAWFLQRYFAVKSLNYALVGRWLLCAMQGDFKATPIVHRKVQKFEVAIGWSVHYVIGIVLAMLFFFSFSQTGLHSPQLLPALLFGVISVALPFFIMQPALGLGVAANKTLQPNLMRLKSLMAHTSFGVGLYISAQCLVWLN
ncbi:DUF2938 family protein [Catenovulum sp. SM1970]|uniref:DUF2938 family protein n=1 Tax=Marinifaba aquimaris TaxID=2741323 RepID=UPI00157249AB|nr:DUF2938 family protein [Marinifaba aquimaris]NTS76201.1 DUF2938 family protein [Marinifaba aquimaris]